MTGGLKVGFAQKVEDTYGKENIVVVHHSKSGRGIRFWDKDYRFPDGHRFPGKGVPSERSKQQHGQEYGPLIGKVREAIEGKSFDTVTFVWMQVSRMEGRGLGPVYEESSSVIEADQRRLGKKGPWLCDRPHQQLPDERPKLEIRARSPGQAGGGYRPWGMDRHGRPE